MLEPLLTIAPNTWTPDACGVDRDSRVIEALVHKDAYEREGPRASILIVGDLTGQTPGDVVVRAVGQLARQIGADAVSALAISAIPSPYGDGPDTPAFAPYPPVDGYFDHDDHDADPVSRYIWRWVSQMAPDLVVELRAGETTQRCATDRGTAERFAATDSGIEEYSLLGALGRGTGDAPGPIPCLRITAPDDELGAEVIRLFSIIGESGLGPSGARRNLTARRSRSPTGVVRILTGVYGYTLDPVVYTQGVSIGGRLIAWEIGITQDDPSGNIREIAGPLLANPIPFLESGPDGAALAGLTWACDLARITGDKQARNLSLAAADQFEDAGDSLPPSPADDDFRVEDMFFVSTVLGQAYQLTGNTRYSLLLDKYMRNCLESGVQRPDGLFDHSQGSRFAWGRGNGFAALGYAEGLTYLPPDSPVRSDLAKAHRSHIWSMITHAAPSGKQRQLTDFPGSYEELSATSMLGIALARGLRLGSLPETYRPELKWCWNAVSESIDDDGGLVDVCAGTGPQFSVREYLDRPAVSGLDDRGGAMAMWFALEMAKVDSASV